MNTANDRWLMLRRLVLLSAMASLFWMAGPGQAQTTSKAQAVARRAKRVTDGQRQLAASMAKPGRPGAAALRAAPMAAPPQGGTPNYFGPEPNWAWSPQPVVDPNTGKLTGGIRKFVDSLPGLTPAGANNLGQYIPIAVPDTITYPGSDYYEIVLEEYTQQLHSDLHLTTLRGYRQVNNGTDANGQNTVAPDPHQYLGPLIVAQKDRPVRVKFTNLLPTGTGGNLFLPVDTTEMGAGMGPLGMNAMPMNYTQNRGTLHLHGGRTPWISDGTPHQWITPAGEMTSYPQGVSVQNVPDMPDPGTGSMTFFYTNQQSARLMFYHDHAYGITRLNVYAGEAAGYVVTDPTEQQLITNGVLPDLGIPLIIQDKTFVDPTTVLTTDPTWPFLVDATGTKSDLWYPHVYMPNQNPNDPLGVNPFGRWDYGPWFWPPWPVTNLPKTLPDGTVAPNLPDLSMTMEAYHDTPVINGTPYPYLDVQPKAYRFRILNAANDRFWNLGLYVAINPATPTELQMVPASKSCPTYPAGALDPNGVPYPAGTLINFPAWWTAQDTLNQPGDILDGRASGVPDPALIGPDIIQIGTEGGFLPAPCVWKSTPIGWDRDPKSITVGNVKDHGLFLGCAERADVIIDFSQFGGKTLILYNDAPAAVPGYDSRLDYYTGDSDQTSTGGTVPTQPGYGPNTRTIMQIRVAAGTGTAYDMNKLNAAFASTATTQGVFAASQDPIIVPQDGYNSAYNATFPNNNTAYGRIQDTSLTFTPLNATAPITVQFGPKAIQELFENAYGRMNATLGVELPFTNGGNQTTLPFGYIDPVTEFITDSVTPMSPVLGDGTQIWKITHNGVDTHPVHFHLFDVQLVNRVDWAGVVKPPEPNELGWKETIRMNPLEDCIVALRPCAPKLTFGVPDSVRPLDPTMPVGSSGQFSPWDPLGNPVTTTNDVFNFGWEYVWHCHILSHEEMDMMRAVAFSVARTLPTAPVVHFARNTTVTLTWTDGTPVADPATPGNPANEIGYKIMRAPIGNNGKPGTYVQIGAALANATSYVDATIDAISAYSYQVVAYNAAGDSPSAPVTVNPPIPPPAAPTNLTATLQAGPQVALTWRDNATNETGFTVERSDNGGPFAQIAAPPRRNNTGNVSYTDATVLPGNTYQYRVAATGAGGTSAYSNVVSVTTPAAPAAPTNLVATAARANLNNDRVTLTWTDNANNETGFTVQRATNAAFTTGLNTSTVGAAAGTGTTVQLVQTGLARNRTFWYRVRADGAGGSSGWSNVVTVTTP